MYQIDVEQLINYKILHNMNSNHNGMKSAKQAAKSRVARLIRTFSLVSAVILELNGKLTSRLAIIERSHKLFVAANYNQALKFYLQACHRQSLKSQFCKASLSPSLALLGLRSEDRHN